jgi:membrane-bound inhibitor of C-type lysozyme
MDFSDKKSFLMIAFILVVVGLVVVSYFMKAADFEKKLKAMVELSLKRKFFSENECKVESIKNERYDFSNVTYDCKRFKAFISFREIQNDVVSLSKTVFLFKKSVSLYDLQTILDLYFNANAYKTILNCSQGIRGSGGRYNFTTYNCSIPVTRFVYFRIKDKMVSNPIDTLHIQVNRTSKEELIGFAKKLYAYKLSDYGIVTIPPGLYPENCSVDYSDEAGIVRVDVCKGTYLLAINKSDDSAFARLDLKKFM